MLAVSTDTPDEQRQLAAQLKLPFALLSDPRMSVIRAYGMKGSGMDMVDMGYVIVDKRGRIRARQIDRRPGDHSSTIVAVLRQANAS